MCLQVVDGGRMGWFYTLYPERYKDKFVGIQGNKVEGKGELRGSGECRRRGKLLVRG